MLSTRKFVALWPGVIALALAAAAPAGAVVRTAPFAWTPAAGPVAGYRLYLSVDGLPLELHGAVNTPSAVILLDTGAEVVMRVAAYDSSGREGPLSDPSEPLRLCPGDFDGDETVEQTDMNRALACYLKPGTGTCAAADMNGDGTVTYSDIKAITVGADACDGYRPVPGCPGDIDRDGLISYQDLQVIRTCLSLEAEGACIDADLDGNCFVTNQDWLAAGRSIGAACSQ
jgi:hypothetical protein